MTARGPRDRIVLAVAAAAAVAVPWAASAHLSRRIADDLEPALTDTLGEQVFVGGIEAGLTGELALRDVRVGRVLSAERIEAGVALSSLFGGVLDADEVRIEGPRITARIDADGGSNLARMIERAAARRAGAAAPRPGHGSARQRRIVVTGGDLVVDVDGWGRVTLSGVALHPHAGGLRAVAGATTLELEQGAWQVRGRLERAAADLTLPGLRVTRALLVGGGFEIAVSTIPAALALEQVSVARGIDGKALTVHGRVAGAPGDAAVTLRLDRDGTAWTVGAEGKDVPLALLMPLVPVAVNLADARASGQVQVTADPAAWSLAVVLDAAIAGVVLGDARLAAAPVPLSGQATLRASMHGRDARTLAIEELRVTMGGLAVDMAGSAQYLAGTRSWLPDAGTVSLRVPPVACATALGSLPEPLRDRLAGLDMTGTLEARAALTFTRDTVDDTELALDVDVASCRVLREAEAANPRVLEQPLPHTFPDGSRGVIGPGQPGYVALGPLPSHLVHAFVSAEDGRFFRHRGFDAAQIERSLAIDLRDRAFVRGGSTISQQLVKNVFLSHDRTLARKLQEAVLTWRLEAALDKNTILERYLNIIELGPGVFGVSAAARHWLDKDVAALGIRESAFLASLTRAPRTLSRRITESRGIDADMNGRIDTVLRAMRRDGAITQASYQRALGETITLRPALLATH